MQFKVSSAGLVTVLGILGAIAGAFIPGASHSLQQGLAIGAGIVSSGYAHGKLTGSGASQTVQGPRS